MEELFLQIIDKLNHHSPDVTYRSDVALNPRAYYAFRGHKIEEVNELAKPYGLKVIKEKEFPGVLAGYWWFSKLDDNK